MIEWIANAILALLAATVVAGGSVLIVWHSRASKATGQAYADAHHAMLAAISSTFEKWEREGKERRQRHE